MLPYKRKNKEAINADLNIEIRSNIEIERRWTYDLSFYHFDIDFYDIFDLIY